MRWCLLWVKNVTIREVKTENRLGGREEGEGIEKVGVRKGVGLRKGWEVGTNPWDSLSFIQAYA